VTLIAKTSGRMVSPASLRPVWPRTLFGGTGFTGFTAPEPPRDCRRLQPL